MRIKLSLCLSAFLSLLAAMSAQAQSAYFQAVTNLNPVAYWPLNETTPPPAADVETNRGSLGPLANAFYSSTQAQHGYPGVLASEPGDTAVSLNSGQAGGFLAVPLTDPRVAVPVGPFTVEAWIYPSNYSGVGIVSQTGPAGSGGLNGGLNSAGWSLTEDYIASQNSGNLQGWCFHVFNGVTTYGSGTYGGAEAVAGPGFVLNQWYHIVGVFDGTNATLYVNGTNASSSGYQIPMPAGTSYKPDNWNPLFIGAARGFNNNRFLGNMDEIAIYTNALSAAQVQNHFQTAQNPSPATPYEQVVQNDQAYMYWRMNAPAYTVPAAATYPLATNYGSLGAGITSRYAPGTVPGLPGPSYPGFGTNSLAVAINGIGGSGASPCVDAGYSSLLDPTGNTNSFTVVGWFKGNPMDSNGRFECAIGHSDSSWRFAFNNGNARWNYGGSGAGDVIIPPTTINANDGNWHMFAGVYYATNNAITPGTQVLWIDGSATLSSANIQNIPGRPALDVLLGGAPDNVAAGNGNSYNQRFFPGSLAQIAFFTNALSAQQIRGLYSVAVAGTPPVVYLQPTSGTRTNVGGTSITFNVGASGATNLIYQWFFNNGAGAVALADDAFHTTGAASNLLTLTNLVDGETGNYFVVVSNNYGAVTSSISGLQVYQEPWVTAQNPAAAFKLSQNQNFTLSVAAIGTPALGYQWYTNGVADTTAGTSSSYALVNVQPALAGTIYRCVVTNAFGQATNQAVTLLAVQSLPTNSYAQAIGALNPAGYWPMHESSAAVGADSETNYGTLGGLANGYYGDWQVNGGSPGNQVVFHQLAGALLGDNNTSAGFTRQGGSFLIVPHTSPLATLKAPFTLEAWVKPFDNSYGIIMGVGGGNANGNGTGLNANANLGGFDWNWAGSLNSFSMTVRNGNGSAGTEPKTTADYPPGNWYHLVTTFDGTNVTYFVNGNQVNLQNSSAATMNPDSWSPLCVGGGRWSGSINRPFDGAIDEVAVYTNLLQPSDISAHYAAGSGSSPNPTYKQLVLAHTPIVYLRMDSPPYATPATSTWAVLNNYGSAAGNGLYRPSASPGGIAGPSESGNPVAGLGSSTALAGDGISVFADAGFNPAFNPTGRTPMSVTVWAKGNPADVSQRAWQTFAGHSDAGWRITINGGTGKFGFDSGNGLDVASTQIGNDGLWHHVTGTYDGSNTTVYVDGQFSAKGTSANTIAGTTAYGVYLGSSPNGQTNASGGRQWAGNMCEVAFFNGTALTAQQVSNIYNAALVPPFITTQPVLSSTANQNGAFTNTVAAGGSGPLSYQWYKNGTPIGGQTSASLLYNPVTTNNASTNYYVVISNAYGSVTSVGCSLTVFSIPAFAVQPTSTTITNSIKLFAGAHPTFKAFATGAQPVQYQWLTNNVPVPGATNISYTLPNVPASGFNSFACYASNFVGVTTSAVVTVSVLPSPASPYPQAVAALNPAAYWRLNEADDALGDGNAGIIASDYLGGINGIYTNTSLGQPGYNAQTDPLETSAQFGFTSFTDSDAGQIAGGIIGTNVGAGFTTNLVFGIDYGAATNRSMAFSVSAWVNGGVQTADAGIVTKGYGGAEQFTLDTGADGGNPNHAFRWFVRDANGATHLATSSIAPDNNWHHLVGVCDEPNGVVTLYVDGVKVGNAAVTPGSGILASTNGLTIGSRMTTATSGNNVQFVGSINDVAVFNYALTSLQVSNLYYPSGIGPKITQQPPAAVSVNENGTLVVHAAAVGTAPLAYHWTDANTGLPVPGQTSPTLTINNFPLGLNGETYLLTVTNLYGTVDSSTVTVSVNSGAPQFAANGNLPALVSAVSGTTYLYAPQVTGTQPFGYQWYNGVNPIGGQTGPTYSLTVASGNYSVVVTNIYGTVTSTVSAMTVVAPLTTPYAQTLQSYGAVGYWPLNETIAPPAADIETNLGTLGAAGNAYYVAYANIQQGTPGAITGDADTAVTLGAANGHWLGVPRRSPSLTASNAFSVEAWVKPQDFNFAAIVSQANPIGAQTVGFAGDANVNGWALYQNGGSLGNFSFHVYNGISGGGAEPKESTLYALDTWFHVVGVFDGVGVTLYVNGLASVTAQSQPAPGYAPNYWSPVEIGASGMNRSLLNGSVDEVAVYNYAISSAQVQAHYNAGTSGAGNYQQVIVNDAPYLYYRMNAPTYTPPASNSYPQAVNYGSLGANADGFYQPGTVPGVQGPPSLSFGATNRSVAINGLNSCVNIPYNTLLDPTGQTPFTITGWFQGNPADGAGRWEEIFSHGESSWRFHINNTVPQFSFGGVAGGLAPDVTIATNLVAANNNKWHFFAGTYDGFTYTLYIDSVTNSAVSGGLIPGANLDILIGGSPTFTEFGNNGGFNERYFPGNIAQVAFFTNTLASAQIQQLYAVGTFNTPTISIGNSGGHTVITYLGVLSSSVNANGPYTPVPGASSPYIVPLAAPQQFYRTSLQ
jgi:hypothetical protein